MEIESVYLIIERMKRIGVFEVKLWHTFSTIEEPKLLLGDNIFNDSKKLAFSKLRDYKWIYSNIVNNKFNKIIEIVSKYNYDTSMVQIEAVENLDETKNKYEFYLHHLILLNERERIDFLEEYNKHKCGLEKLKNELGNFCMEG